MQTINQRNEAGQRHGLWEEYHYSNNKIKNSSYYMNGVLDGLWTQYRSNGNVHYRTYYKNDLREGLSEGYYENNVLSYRGIYRNDKPFGYWIINNINGTLTKKRFYAR
jgi:antitoxin component YwqK of YwqJK toxin-antitoxin module